MKKIDILNKSDVKELILKELELQEIKKGRYLVEVRRLKDKVNDLDMMMRIIMEKIKC